jgi:hypothetical protein
MERINFHELAENERNIVLIKGYGGRWGQGWKGILASWRVRSKLIGIKILVYSPSMTALILIAVFRKLGLPIMPVPRVSRDDFLELLRFTHIHIGISKSDGLATTSAEAGLMGAYVIQSSTSCVDEYLRNLGTVHLLHSRKVLDIASLFSTLLSLPRRHEFASLAKAREAAEKMSAVNVYRIWLPEFMFLLSQTQQNVIDTNKSTDNSSL